MSEVKKLTGQAFGALVVLERAGSASGVKGVCKHGASYKAIIGVGGRVITLGSFQTIEEAAAARKAAENLYWKGGHSF